MHSFARRRQAVRAALAVAVLAGLAGCGRKGEIIDLLPPPAPTTEQAPGTGG